MYVATGFSHTLQAFKIDAEGALADRVLDVKVEREPRAVSLSADGKRAFVAHAASSKLEVVDVGAAALALTTDLGIPASASAGDTFGMAPPPMRVMRMRQPHVIFDALVPVAVASDVVAQVPMAFDDCFDCGNGGIDNFSLPARFARQGYTLAHVSFTTSKGAEEAFVIPHTEVMTGDPMVISSGYGGGGVESVIDEPTERFTLSLVDVATGKRKLLPRKRARRAQQGRLPPPARQRHGPAPATCGSRASAATPSWRSPWARRPSTCRTSRRPWRSAVSSSTRRAT